MSENESVTVREPDNYHPSLVTTWPSWSMGNLTCYIQAKPPLPNSVTERDSVSVTDFEKWHLYVDVWGYEKAEIVTANTTKHVNKLNTDKYPLAQIQDELINGGHVVVEDVADDIQQKIDVLTEVTNESHVDTTESNTEDDEGNFGVGEVGVDLDSLKPLSIDTMNVTVKRASHETVEDVAWEAYQEAVSEHVSPFKLSKYEEGVTRLRFEQWWEENYE